MNSIFVLSETFTNGYRAEVLDFISLACILCGILVIISKNPVVSVLFLIGLFLSIASYLILLGLNFIGLSYLLVYVGAVSILFLFILMLINVRISELLSATSNSIPLAIIITIAFNYPVYQVLPYSIAAFNSYTVDLNNTFNVIFNFTNNNYSDYLNKFFNLSAISNSNQELDLGEISFVTSKIWDGNLAESTHITSIGNIMYTSYSIWLIITSIILLLAMVGTIVIVVKSPVENASVKSKNVTEVKSSKEVSSINSQIRSYSTNSRSRSFKGIRTFQTISFLRKDETFRSGSR